VSSKGRKKKDVADGDSEYYPTPGWCVHRFIERATFLPKGKWLEPCAGNGDIIHAVNEKRQFLYWHANEIRPACEPGLRKVANQVVISNFLGWDFKTAGRFDVIVSNPPFSLAMPIIQKSLELADYVAMLLRLNYMGSAERTPFFKEMMPDLYVIPERPSFDGEGTDSIEYAWFVWMEPELRKRSRGSIEVLDNTPIKVRKAFKPLDFRLPEEQQMSLL